MNALHHEVFFQLTYSGGVTKIRTRRTALLTLTFFMVAAALLGPARRADAAPEGGGCAEARCQSVIFLPNPDRLQHKIIAALINQCNPRLSPEHQILIREAIFREARAWGFDPFFLAGVIAAESSFSPQAISPRAAMGLMQLSDGVARAARVREPFEIQQNIYAGARYLRHLKSRFGRDELVLAAYNAGPSRIARLGRLPRIPETVSYVRKVLALWHGMAERLTVTLRDIMHRPVLCPLFEKMGAGPGTLAFAGQNNEPAALVMIIRIGLGMLPRHLPSGERPDWPFPIIDQRRLDKRLLFFT